MNPVNTQMPKAAAAAANLMLCLFLLVLTFLEISTADNYIRPPPRQTLHFDFRSKSSSKLPQQVISLRFFVFKFYLDLGFSYFMCSSLISTYNVSYV